MKRKAQINPPKIKVIKVKEQRRYSDRRTVFLADGRVFGLPGDVFLSKPVHSGDELDEAEILDLISRGDRQKLVDTALNLLSYRARSRGELLRRLSQKGWDKAEILPVLDDLEEKDYLNDHEFAKMLAHDRIKFKQLGPLGLKSELIKLAVSDLIIAQVIEEYYPAGTEESLIEQIIAGKSKVDYDDPKQRKKILDLLARKGFSWNKINAVIQQKFPRN